MRWGDRRLADAVDVSCRFCRERTIFFAVICWILINVLKGEAKAKPVKNQLGGGRALLGAIKVVIGVDTLENCCHHCPELSKREGFLLLYHRAYL